MANSSRAGSTEEAFGAILYRLQASLIGFDRGFVALEISAQDPISVGP
jgi:hypothetical protein